MSKAGTLETPQVGSTAVRPVESGAASNVLRGDEIIELSIKPSHWYILFKSFRVVFALLVFAIAVAIVARDQWNWGAMAAVQAVLAIACLRVVIATLQWASRLYVLTNRRVLRFQGVLNVDVSECPLARVQAADLTITWYQRIMRLGTITVQSADDSHRVVTWKHIKRPHEVHERLLRAISSAQSGPQM